MATYYVRTDGNNSNAGTGSGTGQAWATVAHALGGTGTASGVTGGDTIYIAPGKYAGLTIAVAPSSLLNVIGDPSGAQFGYTIAPGPVHVSNVLDRVSGSYTHAITATSKDYINLKNLVIGGITTSACHNWIIDSCHSYNASSTNVALVMTFTANVNANTVIKNSTFYVGGYNLSPIVITFGTHSTTYTSSFRIDSVSLVANQGTGDIVITCANATGIVLSNIYGLKTISVTGTVANQAKIINSIISVLTGSVGGNLVEDYNIFTARVGGNRTNVATGLNSVVVNAPLIYGDTMAQTGAGAFSAYQPAPTVFAQLIGYGTTTDAPTNDFFGNAYGTPMTIGIAKSATLTGAGVYSATERNASTITIAPGSTSQSIELYLGATGLAFNTSGLQAYYIRNRSAPVAITLVTQTATGAWTSGGFAEISSSLTPGVYRLDVPDAAFAAGSTDVTLVVRGAAGTNGAVVTITLSAGGLSSVETANAVWNATASSYNTAGSMGEAGQRLTGYSLASSQTFSTTGSVGSVTGAVGSVTGSVGSVTGSVGSVTGAVGSVTSAVTVGTNNDKSGYSLSSAGNTSAAGAVWNSARSSYTTAGTFGQYVNAELVTPVTQSALVRMGPYEVKADGLGASDPLDIQKGAQHGVDIQCVDGNGNGIDITSATVTAKVYNSGGSLVDTYSCTATYAADGRATFTIDTTVTNVPGTYTATITRTTGASDTQVFGPLRIYVRDI